MRKLNFSIIIPTYNRAYILQKAIDSILKQEGEHDFEIIVIDDGSNDKTANLIQQSQDERIKYYYKENQGPSAARNTGLAHASKNWIIYLDSDNELFPNYFNVLEKYLRKNKTALYVAVKARKILSLYENGKVIKSKEERGNSLKERITLQDLFFNKVYFDTNGFAHSRKFIEAGFRWDKNLTGIEDWDFLMQIGERYPKNFLYISEPLVLYNLRFGTDGVISNASYKYWADSFEYIYQKHKSDKLMQGQTWYPAKVQKYRQYQKDFEAGKISPQHIRWFEE